jgi:hypothetical protein
VVSLDYSLARDASLEVRWFDGSLGPAPSPPAPFADVAVVTSHARLQH